MREVWNSTNLKFQKSQLLYIYSYEETSLGLCKVFRNASSHKMRLNSCMNSLLQFYVCEMATSVGSF